jgi:putative FmdB family regulatory protein
MPLYEYACDTCGHRFDVRHSADERPALTCPECEGATQKVFHAAGIIFKGSGWHINDYAPKAAKCEKSESCESTSCPAKQEAAATS